MSSVLSCDLAKDGRSARIDEKGVRRYTLKYIIRTDDVSIAMLEALLSTGSVPGFYAHYHPSSREFDYYATAREWDISQTDDPRVWEVTVNYSSEFSPANDANNVARDAGNLTPSNGSTPSPSSGVGSQSQTDPILRQPDVSWTFVKYSRTVMFAFDPNYNPNQPADDDVEPANQRRNPQYTPIVSSAGEPYDPPVEIDDCRPVYRVSRNERFFNAGLAEQYMNKVNSDNFKGAKPGQAKIESITGELQWERNVPYWRVNYEIHFRIDGPYGWALRLLDMGTQKLVGDKFITIKDDHGIPVTNPVLLDGNGGRLSKTEIAAGHVHWRTYDVYQSVKFATLKLP